MDIWYDKYNKYKKKYLDLKNKSLSGGIDNNNIGYYERLEKERQEERERERQEERDRIRQEARDEDKKSANRGNPPQHKIIIKTPPNPQNPFNKSDMGLIQQEEEIQIDFSKIQNQNKIIYNNPENYEIDGLLDRLGQNFGYLTDSMDDIKKRIIFLNRITHNLNDAYKIYNEEKANMEKDYDKLIDLYLYSNIFTHYYPSLELTKLSESKDNVGIIKLDKKDVVYKRLNTLIDNVVPELDKLNKSYEFVKMYNDKKREFHMYDTKYKEYNIDIVNIHNNIVIIGKDIGYSMDLVHGKTLQDFKSDVNYKEKKEIIKNAIKSLIDRLTQIDFLVYDLHLDNLMWDDNTNTLTLIDITENSFGRKRHEIVSNNETAKYDILRQV